MFIVFSTSNLSVHVYVPQRQSIMANPLLYMYLLEKTSPFRELEVASPSSELGLVRTKVWEVWHGRERLHGCTLDCLLARREKLSRLKNSAQQATPARAMGELAPTKKTFQIWNQVRTSMRTRKCTEEICVTCSCCALGDT